MALMGATGKELKKTTDAEAAEQGPLTEEESLRQTSLKDSLTRSAALKSKAVAEEVAHMEQSVLKSKLSAMATNIGYGGLIVALCTLIMLIIRFCLNQYAVEGNSVRGADLRYFVYYFTIGVTILVVAVPEGNNVLQ